ncbi:methylmalonyl Co-A mutase-associated GTPase MeaB [Echinicola strongylocentroti]|uniref:Methylmalonyl Co-A mutase-associated GTPase MeaB n=1 Tax=Echinicola strongylocentroti TaxID=1795355 RepID=A0A2Z4IFF1_9BACT|nr:methylmalonyl Co-A mutase-associated GTPase MeaB [Echinicola strongylocentroti]AWW29812.1 methylmalonyl Co-A mutase-associated GTPase MeaB [Echinicola strongylocentroti]
MPENKQNRWNAATYVDGVLSGDRAMLSRAITLVESRLEADRAVADQVINLLLPHTGNAKRIGITGAPGVGKSTFIEQLGQKIIKMDHRLAVLSVDPSSAKSGGSILGDKTRMEQLSKTEKAFIRPSPGSGHQGGVSAFTREAMLLCEAAGYEVVIVETIGVGQSEVQVKEMVDFFMLLVQPESGDELQGVKRGMMEMVDAIVVNKADRSNLEKAKQTQKELESALHLLHQEAIHGQGKVMLASSLEGSGFGEIWKATDDYFALIQQSGFLEQNRSNQRAYWFYAHVQQALERQFYQNPTVKEKMVKSLDEVRQAETSPAAVARGLVEEFFKKLSSKNR